jgi:hypothetical protein
MNAAVGEFSLSACNSQKLPLPRHSRSYTKQSCVSYEHQHHDKIVVLLLGMTLSLSLSLSHSWVLQGKKKMGVEKELCIKGSPLKQLNSNVLCSVPGLPLTKMPVQAVADNGKSISSNAKYVTLQKYFSHPSLSKSTPHWCSVCDPAN